MGREAKELFLYDSLHRLIEHTDPLFGATTRTSYDDCYINEKGQRVLRKTTIDPLLNKQIEIFNARGLLAVLEKKNSSGQTLSQEKFFYDVDDHLVLQVSTLFPGGLTVATIWEYDAMGRSCVLTEAASSFESRQTRTMYTRKGKVHQISQPPHGLFWSITMIHGNLVALTSSDQTISDLYYYNTLNALVQVEDQVTGRITTRTYDCLGRLIQEQLGSGLCMDYAYENRGRRILLTLPDNSSVAYAYDPLHLREVGRYDTQGMLVYSHNYEEYDLSGYVLSEKLLCEKELFTAFDLAGRKNETSSPFFTKTAQYDAVGNILTLQSNACTTHYAYDDLYQLIEEQGNRSTHTYAYDSHYNRLEKDGIGERPNALNQISCFTYDLNGNPISYADTYYRYDALNRLIAVEQPTQRLYFSYDAFHRRLSKTVRKHA